MLQEMKLSNTSRVLFHFLILKIALNTRVVTLKALLKEENLSTSTSGSADVTSTLKVALTLLLGATRLLLAADKQLNQAMNLGNLEATKGHVAKKTIVSQIH